MSPTQNTLAGRRIAAASLVSLALFALLPGCVAQDSAPGSNAEEAIVTVDASRPAGPAIPRTIFGSFLEPIGHSTYGGLWAEILENPSFEENLWSAGAVREMIANKPELARSSQLGLPLPWQPLDPAQGNRYEPRWNDAANSYRSVFIMGLPTGQVGVRQEVYLPVHRTLHYTGSLYAKYASGPRELEVSIRQHNHAENVLARAAIHTEGSDWKRYDFQLEVPRGKIAPLQSADFAIAVTGEGRYLIDAASLIPADNIDGMDPDVIAMAKAMKSPVVRFGGNFTSAYHWRDGIGPRDKRVSMLNVAWGIPEYNTFGTDEFLRFCQLIGAEPQIALNLGSGTPEEASSWAQYVNEHWANHSGGLLWELGNELWGSFQVGYPTLQRVADRTKGFSAAVRKVDANSKLIGTGGDEDSFHDWNAAQLTNAGALNYLSTHFVVGTDRVLKPDASSDFIAQADFALPIGLERKLHEIYQQIQSNPEARDRVKIAFTEWLFIGSEDAPRYDNMGGAICTAGFLNMLMRSADIVPVSDMTGILEFGGIWKKRSRVFGVPSYWAFRMYSNADPRQLVPTHVQAEKYDVAQGSARLPSIPDVPYLDVVAALSDDKLLLFCVNRHLTRDIPARISITGFEAAPEAAAQTLYATSIYEQNDEMHPLAIRPKVSSVQLNANAFEYSFRHESVTVLTLQKKH
jgi:alpha-L-arabinofuranosidase